MRLRLEMDQDPSLTIVDNKYMKCNNVNIYSWSCLIDEGDTFLLTGGTLSSTRTSRYSRSRSCSRSRWLQNLDDLNTGRYDHACGWYTDTDGRRVRYM